MNPGIRGGKSSEIRQPPTQELIDCFFMVLVTSVAKVLPAVGIRALRYTGCQEGFMPSA